MARAVRARWIAAFAALAFGIISCAEQSVVSTIPTETVSAPTTPPPGPTPERLPVLEAEVAGIIDGDTIRVTLLATGESEKVRLIGIDTPERGQAFSDQATELTRDVLEGRTVYLELDVDRRDRYGRLLAYVWLRRPTDGSSEEVRQWMFNGRLLRRGYAVTLTIPPNVQYVDDFKEFQREARESENGLWRPKPKPKPRREDSSPNCHPSYSGACLRPDASDYDCAGGSGDGLNRPGFTGDSPA